MNKETKTERVLEFTDTVGLTVLGLAVIDMEAIHTTDRGSVRDPLLESFEDLGITIDEERQLHEIYPLLTGVDTKIELKGDEAALIGPSVVRACMLMGKDPELSEEDHNKIAKMLEAAILVS